MPSSLLGALAKPRPKPAKAKAPVKAAPPPRQAPVTPPTRLGAAASALTAQHTTHPLATGTPVGKAALQAQEQKQLAAKRAGAAAPAKAAAPKAGGAQPTTPRPGKPAGPTKAQLAAQKARAAAGSLQARYNIAHRGQTAAQQATATPAQIARQQARAAAGNPQARYNLLRRRQAAGTAGPAQLQRMATLQKASMAPKPAPVAPTPTPTPTPTPAPVAPTPNLATQVPNQGIGMMGRGV